MKKVIILQHSGGRLADQLWRFASVYAYCLEKGFLCRNYSFSDYGYYFNFPVGNFFVDLIFFKILFFLHKFISKFSNRNIQRKLYSIYVKYKLDRIKKWLINSQNNPYFLAPSSESAGLLLEFEKSDQKEIIFIGNSFFSPVGLEKYHQQIVSYFSPKKKYLVRAKKHISSLRGKFDYIVGVHIRHGDFKTWQDGKYYFSFQDVRKILDSFLEYYGQTGGVVSMVAFYICSDEKVDESFVGLNYQVGEGGMIDNLCSLSLTDRIIGSTASGFGIWASYYGDIPFVSFSRELKYKNSEAQIHFCP